MQDESGSNKKRKMERKLSAICSMKCEMLGLGLEDIYKMKIKFDDVYLELARSAQPKIEELNK